MMRRAAAIGILLAGFAAAPVAWADAIDGEWCSAKGLNLEIHGPKIRLPSGATIDGHYARHEFAYEALKDSDEAGYVIYMELQNEEEMLLRRLKNGVVGEPELWRRCNVTS